jgi:hypothetical protein
MLLETSTNTNYEDGNFSNTSENVYAVYAGDQVGRNLTRTGTLNCTNPERWKKFKGT